MYDTVSSKGKKYLGARVEETENEDEQNLQAYNQNEIVPDDIDKLKTATEAKSLMIRKLDISIHKQLKKDKISRLAMKNK